METSRAVASGELPRLGRRSRSSWVWAALGALLVLYVFSAWRVGPIATFGTMRDDALYFSSAKSLANGQGYILPGFPVRLRATKYPELYPLLLAGVWKIDPHFPGNVHLAVGLTLAFGCAALLFAFLLLRRWPGVGDWQALIVVAFCALTGYFLQLSASILTDVPFMALMLGAAWLAEVSLERENNGDYWMLGAGLLAGLAVGMRSLGVAVIAGIGIVLLARRHFKKLLWFSLAAAPLTLLFLWPAIIGILHPSGARLAIGPGDSGWTQTLCYYSSYACNWRMNVTSPRILEAVILGNLKSVIQEPGLYLLLPLASFRSLLSLLAVTLLGVAAYLGVMRHARAAGVQVLAITFLFYLPAILAWPYTPNRFLVPFLPLFFGGIWTEGHHFAKLVGEYAGRSHPAHERILAGLLAASGLALISALAINYVSGIPTETAAQAQANRSLLQDERGAYAWIKLKAAPNAKIIAYEDGRAYFYTDHSSGVPIQSTTQGFYTQDNRYAEHDAARVTSVAKHIRASYWLSTPADYSLDGAQTAEILRKAQAQLLGSAPLVYESADGSVRLYDIRDLTQSGRAPQKPERRDAATRSSK